MRVNVEHSIGDLAKDCARVVLKAERDLPRIVERNVNRGHKLAQGIARKASGPHGLNYWKRITAESTGPLSGEYGPTGDVVGNAVGAGWRSGPPNTDLEKSLDVVGPAFGKQVSDAADKWFW